MYEIRFYHLFCKSLKRGRLVLGVFGNEAFYGNAWTWKNKVGESARYDAKRKLMFHAEL